MVFWVWHPPLNANVRFLYLFLQPHPVYDQTQGSGTFFSLLYLHLYDQCFRISHVIALALSPDTSLYCSDTNFLPYCTLFGCVIDTKRHISVYYRKMLNRPRIFNAQSTVMFFITVSAFCPFNNFGTKFGWRVDIFCTHDHMPCYGY